MNRVLVFALPILGLLSVLGIGFIAARTHAFGFRRGAVANEVLIEEASE